MKLVFKFMIVLTALTAPLAVQAQSIVINLPHLSWPTQTGPGSSDAAGLGDTVCTAGQ